MLSAFLINDVVCVALTPQVLSLRRQLRCPPILNLVGPATTSNVSSLATITGNPQNIIGSLLHISTLRSAATVTPISAINLVLNVAVVALVYRKAPGGASPLAQGVGRAG